MGKILLGVNMEFVRHHDKPFDWGVAKAAEIGYQYVEPMVHWAGSCSVKPGISTAYQCMMIHAGPVMCATETTSRCRAFLPTPPCANPRSVWST